MNQAVLIYKAKVAVLPYASMLKDGVSPMELDGLVLLDEPVLWAPLLLHEGIPTPKGAVLKHQAMPLLVV